MRIAKLCFLGSMVVFTLSLAVSAHAQVCTSNADCPSPLTCKEAGSSCSQGGGILPDGGVYVSDPVCGPARSVCTWTFVRCQADSDCALAPWACLLVPDQTVIKTCFPKAIDCSAGQGCPAGWSCLDLSQWQEGDEPLKIWKVKSGTQFCWPDSLKAVLDHTHTAGTDPTGLGLSSSGDSDSASATGAAGAPGSTKEDSTSTSKSSGCTMAGQGASAHLGTLAFALLGLLSLGRALRRK